jgi:hypothetical protein
MGFCRIVCVEIAIVSTDISHFLKWEINFILVNNRQPHERYCFVALAAQCVRHVLVNASMHYTLVVVY